MQKYWVFTQKNVFSELLSFLGRRTQENLTHQIEYLKVENEILRKRVGRSIRPTSKSLKRKDIKIAMIVAINHGYLPLSSVQEREFTGVPLL
jgi:hypothetical protein